MTIGDLIYRIDMPTLGTYKIVGQSEDWNAWEVERVNKRPGTLKTGLVFKDDERWVKVK